MFEKFFIAASGVVGYNYLFLPDSVGRFEVSPEAVTFSNPNAESQYSARWQISIQGEMGTNSVLAIGSRGNKAIRLPGQRRARPVPEHIARTEYVANPMADCSNGTGGPSIA